MKRLVMLAAMALAVGLGARAQGEAAEYRLRVPTAGEYVNGLITGFERAAVYSDVVRRIEIELKEQYSDFVWMNYDVVDELFQLFKNQTYNQLDKKLWLNALVISWLTTQDIHLDNVHQFKFHDLTIPVMPIDLNGDGQDEWILDLQQNEIQGYIVLQRDTAGRYQSVDTPLPYLWLEYMSFAAADQPRSRYSIQHLGDINADGLPEAVILFQERDEDGYSTGGRYYILTWGENALLDIGSEELSFYLPSLQTVWEIENTDADTALEVHQIRDMRDNWDCQWTQTIVFDWDGMFFTNARIEESFPDTPTCYMRRAEERMWNHQYQEAISFYEKMDESNPYGVIRLAIAYMLDGQMDEGVARLRALRATNNDYQGLLQLTNTLLTAYEELPSAVNVCIAADNFFYEEPFYIWYTLSLEVGHTRDNIIYGQGMYSAPGAHPETSGCDAPTLIDALLEEAAFSSTKSPTDELERIGLKAHSVYRDDLNGDGNDDWLIWLPSIYISPIFFASGNGAYHVSRAGLTGGYAPDDLRWLEAITLPDGSKALLNIDFQLYRPPTPLGLGLGGGPGVCRDQGSLRIVRAINDELVSVVTALLCQRIAPQDAVNDFDSVSEVYAWDFNENVYDYVPVTFRWNSSHQSYEYPPEIQASLTPAANSSTSPDTPDYILYAYRANDLYVQGQFEDILHYRDQAIAASLDTANPILLKWRYLAASAYEALNRPDEALAEYVDIYEGAPESAWGMLAALHLEIIHPGSD